MHARPVSPASARFPGAPFNPSAALVKALARRRRPALAEHCHAPCTSLPRAYAASIAICRSCSRQKPDIVLMFGLAGRTRAAAHRDAGAQRRLGPVSRCERIPAAARRHRAWRAGGARGGAPFARLLGAVRGERGAGATVARCRAISVQLRLLARIARAPDGRPLVQFVHIPAVRIEAAAAAALASRSPSFPCSSRAAEMLLIALLAASRR